MNRLFRLVYLGGLISFAIFVFYGVAIRYIQPTLDGDIYFNLAYGKQIVEKHCLHINENEYRWTDYSQHSLGLYPSWIPQVVFYFIYNISHSLYFLYSFRIFLLFIFLMVLIAFCYKWRIQPSFFLLTLLFSLYILMRNGLMFKADMFSVLFYFFLVTCYFLTKWTGKKLYLYFSPLIIWLWANSHIGVIMGIVFLGYAFLLELLFNFRSKKKLFIDLFVVFVLSVLTTFITPKPLYYFHFMKNKFAQIAISRFIKNVPVSESYKYIVAFHGLVPDWHSVYFLSWVWVILALVLLTICLILMRYLKFGNNFKRIFRYFPWIIVLLPLPFIKVSWDFARFLHYLAIPAIFSCLFLLKKLPIKRTWDVLVERRVKSPFVYYIVICFELISIFMFLGIFERNLNVLESVNIGDGVWVPVMETNFLISHIPGKHNVFTSYSVGSYIMWKGYPKFKVYIDTRAAETFMDYINFLSKRYWKMKEGPHKLLKRCDIAVISFRHWSLIKYFLDQPGWEVLSFGPTAAIFIKKRDFPNMNFVEPNWKMFTKRLLDLFYPDNLMRFLLYIHKLVLARKFLVVAKNKLPIWYKLTKDKWNFILSAESAPTDSAAFKKYLSGIIKIEKMPFSIQQVVLCLARKRIATLYKRQNYNSILDWEFLVFRFARHRESSLYNKGLCFYRMGRIKKSKIYFSAFLNVIKDLKIKKDDKPMVEPYVVVANQVITNKVVNLENVKLMGI